jgi:uncharacterized membrane protein
LADGRSHWVVEGPAGTALEWDSRITRMVANRMIAWCTEPGSTVRHDGCVRFDPAGDGTRITLRMSYDAAGALGHGIAALLGRDPRRQVDDDLMRMKALVESGAPAHGAPVPAGDGSSAGAEPTPAPT